MRINPLVAAAAAVALAVGCGVDNDTTTSKVANDDERERFELVLRASVEALPEEMGFVCEAWNRNDEEIMTRDEILDQLETGFAANLEDIEFYPDVATEVLDEECAE